MERPEPSFFILIQLHQLQAMLNLGAVANPNTGQPNPIDKEAAEYELSLLKILQEKTQGNLTEKEAEILGETIESVEKIIGELET